jgi:transposase
VDQTLDRRHTRALPHRIIGDNGYDCDPLDRRMRERGIEMIAPNRRQRKKTQDERPPRRYLRRWKIERLFAWLKNFRRINTRWERNAPQFPGHGSARLHVNFVEASVRLVLDPALSACASIPAWP